LEVFEMAGARVYEGTLEEITARHGKDLAGRRLRITVEEDRPGDNYLPFYETASPEEWSRAWLSWTDSHPADGPLLSDAAVSRDSIYEGRG
jgi:hypothetical protein